MPERSSASTASASSTVNDARPSSAAPSESSPPKSSCPPSTFRRISSWYDAMRSVQAPTRNDHVPGRSTVNEPDQWSLPSGSRGGSRPPVVPGRGGGEAGAEGGGPG